MLLVASFSVFLCYSLVLIWQNGIFLTSLKLKSFVEESTDLLEFSKDGDSTAPLGNQSLTTLVMEKCLFYSFFRESWWTSASFGSSRWAGCCSLTICISSLVKLWTKEHLSNCVWGLWVLVGAGAGVWLLLWCRLLRLVT